MVKLNKKDAQRYRQLTGYGMIISFILFALLMGGSSALTACDSRGLPEKNLPELPKSIVAEVTRLPGPTEYQFLYVFVDGDLMVTTKEGYMQVFTAEGNLETLLCATYDAVCVKDERIVLKKSGMVAEYTKEGNRIGEPMPDDRSYAFETSMLRIDRGRTYRIRPDHIEVTENGVTESLILKHRPFIVARTVLRVLLIPLFIISLIITVIIRLHYKVTDLWQ